MDSGNPMRPPMPQPLLLQGRQQKRPWQQMQSASQATPLLGTATSTDLVVVGSASNLPTPTLPIAADVLAQREVQRSAYIPWTDATEAQLFEWLELPRNYQKWKCASLRNAAGSTRTLSLTKKAVSNLISQFFDSLNVKKTPDQIMNKMKYVEIFFKEAEDYLRNTGEGLTSNDAKLGISAIRDKVISICPFYLQVKPFMSESVAINPLYIAETGTSENVEEVLFGSSSGGGIHQSFAEGRSARPRFHEPIHSEGGDDKFQDEDIGGRDEEDVEVDIAAEEEPFANAPSQDVPPAPGGTQNAGTSNQRQRQRKKKPRSVQESIQEMQEQNRTLMEKKLEMHSKHQDRKLELSERQFQLQTVQANMQFQLETSRLELERRRLDIEIMKVNQAREETRVRELALQVELAKLRNNP